MLSTMSDRRITDGGRELRSFLTEHKVSVPDFCEQHGLDRIQVQRVLNGERWKRVSVDFAHSIEKATDGVVPYTSFLPSTAIAPPEVVDDTSADDSVATGTHG